MPKVWNVAVVGCGIGRAHIADGYAAHPDKFRVAAICDVDEARLAKIADEFAIRAAPHLVRRRCWRRMSTSSTSARRRPCMSRRRSAALAAGKHVICEKPIAGSLAEVDQLIAAEQAAPGRLMPIFQYRFGNGVQRAKRIIDLGLAGKPYLATVETAWKRAAAYYATPWRGRLDTELGGVLLTQAIHSHDLMTWLMGPVASVFAATATRVNPIEVEDCAVASLVLRDGALASLAATLGSHKEISRLRFCFEHVTFESSQAPYSPGDDPWEIIPASDAAARADRRGLARLDLRSLALRRADGALSRGARSRRRVARHARRCAAVARARHRAAACGGDGVRVDLPIDASHPKYQGWRPWRRRPAPTAMIRRLPWRAVRDARCG